MLKKISKVLLGLSILMGVSVASASGGFACKSLDGQIKVDGGDSSAGTWVKTVELNGKTLIKETDFTADHLYKGSHFSFLIMDQFRNVSLLRVETKPVPGNEFQFMGTALVNGVDQTQAIVCEFL
ncbi:MAG: hypothetical protein AAF203_10780, partial [Pseudomonadota bacterium]